MRIRTNHDFQFQGTGDAFGIDAWHLGRDEKAENEDNTKMR